MDHLVYVAASGAREAMLAQAVNTHNLANASTAGFRGDLISATSAYINGGPSSTRVFAGMHNSGVDFTHGTINATGRNLDVAINGEGWIAVADADGGEAYTRRGDLRVDEFGQLTNGAGNPVLGESGPIAMPPFSEILVGGDGTVSIVPLGEAPDTTAVVDRIKLVNPDNAELAKGADGLIRTREGEELPADAGVRLIPGSIEASNVDTVGSMVQMIELSRQFENHTRMMKVAEQMDQASTELMKLG
ncbi:MAG: flagellar basal body rod protein FlgF [Halioglobus sp.]|nr:flagellar basal body rod protein FlgF [Halioglobus sp.]